MKPQFIELTITADTGDALAAPRKGLIRFDQITSVVDISSGNFTGPARTQLTLEEEIDYQNEDDEAGGVIRARRSLCVQEDYETVKQRIDSAGNAADS